MKKLIKPIVCLAILLVAIALTTGCQPPQPTVGKATGGGWFIDENTENKCTFGFNAQGKDRPEGLIFTGQFQFKDHGTGQKIHLNEMMGFLDLDNSAMFAGTDKEGIDVGVIVTDLGEPGPGVGDSIEIWHGIKTWTGTILGGNIQVFPID